MALKRDELVNPNGCLSRAGLDEPIFVLRANDDAAPDTVRAWVHNYVKSKGGVHNMTPWQKAKMQEALDLAKEMVVWKSYN